MYYPNDPIEKVKGVGEILEKKYKQAGVKTVGDLLNYFPFRHEDLSQIQKTSQIIENEKTVLKGQFNKISTFVTKNRKKLTKAKFYDSDGELDITWFNSPFIASQINETDTFLLTGKVTKFANKLTIVNPQIDKSEKNSVHTARIVPIYINLSGIYMKSLRKTMLEAIDNTEIADFIEIDNFYSLKEAYKEIHFPTTIENIEKAKDRIALNELIHIKLHSEKQKKINKNLNTNFLIKKSFSNKFIKNLPFVLTEDQNKAVTEIVNQLKSTTPMNVLLSGDVGSGKTIVSIIAAYNVIKNKGKVVYLAPTVVLANQVYNEYTKYLHNTAKIQLVTSQTSNKKFSNGIEDDILIGTHALLNIPNLSNFANLVIIDEQHKFGVKQRAILVENQNPPHVLTMTATPIPRSLALAFFDELNIVQIKSKPMGRKQIKTKVLSENKKRDCYEWIKKEVIKDTKIYYIVPFVNISESEAFKEIKSIEEMEPKLTKYFGKNNVFTLHGKMKDIEKNEVIDKFKKGTGGLLLSTQVVEVGVDVKEATVIVIESADRFGLASLHQLRGRVGRNNLQSYCFLFSQNTYDSKRLKYMEKESDGFKLAQLDLENRGGGEIFGIRQSGEVDLKFVDFKKTEIIKKAKILAKSIIESKENLQRYTNNYFTRDFFYIKDN